MNTIDPATPITDDQWSAFAGATHWNHPERNKGIFNGCGKVVADLRPLYRTVTNDTTIIAGSEAVEVYTTDENGEPQSWMLPVAFPNQASCKLFVDAIQGLEHVKSLGFHQVL